MAIGDLWAVQSLDGTEVANVDSSGNLSTTGSVTATSVVSSGAVSGTTGTFSGAVSGTTGTFTGAVSSAGALTTTQGVASGDSLQVGGRLYTQTAASTAITNTTTQTVFDQGVYSVKANTMTAGKILRVRGQGIATSTNSTDTLTIRLIIGGSETNTTGTILAQSAAVDVANNDIFRFEFDIIPRAAQGATAACVGHGFMFLGTIGSANMVPAFMASTNLATNGVLPVKVSAQWSVASASNSVRMDVFSVEVI